MKDIDSKNREFKNALVKAESAFRSAIVPTMNLVEKEYGTIAMNALGWFIKDIKLPLNVQGSQHVSRFLEDQQTAWFTEGYGKFLQEDIRDQVTPFITQMINKFTNAYAESLDTSARHKSQNSGRDMT